MPVSIFIQTLNEEDNLPSCLDSVSFCDDIVVLDSYSTDRTEEICKERGARFFERTYDGRGTHQNWAMENIDFKHRWVFYLDADEHMTPELRAEIEAVAERWDSGDLNRDTKAPVAYYCGRKNYFRGRWLKHSMPPGLIMRFFQPPHIRFARKANPIPTIDGEVGYLREHFLHFNFSKGLNEWFTRHNKYATYEAEETMKSLKDRPMQLSNLLSRDAMTRRYELKNLSFRMPFRPLLKFLYMYFLKRGFMDGAAGFTYCRLQAMYEYMIVLKVKETQRIERGLPGS
ncbi:MAG: glycosyltransferase family 2 protein [Planctomycetes bacterium]|jgi:glycosyltransferase involved in cell wall biosynthesis|nr:glycosyltransferase family 2 protein [Planctomycetota bacterium]